MYTHSNVEADNAVGLQQAQHRRQQQQQQPRPLSMPSLYGSSSKLSHTLSPDHSHRNHQRTSLDSSFFAIDSSNTTVNSSATTAVTSYNANHWPPANHNHILNTSSSTSSWNRNNDQQLLKNTSSSSNSSHDRSLPEQITATTTNMEHHHSSAINDLLPSIDKHYASTASQSNSVTSPILNTAAPNILAPDNNNASITPSASHTSLMSTIYNSPTYFVSPSTAAAAAAAGTNSNTAGSTASVFHPHQHHHYHQPAATGGYSAYGVTSSANTANHTSPTAITNTINSNTSTTTNNPPRHNLVARPKLTTTLWEDEGTICYQVDANGICVARRQDNDMINGTKLLNVAGMSRGKRDGILKNEKGRVVVKVGAMHLKGVWITFARAKLLATQYKIQDILYPLFVDDPSVFLYSAAAASLHTGGLVSSVNNRFNSFRSPYYSTGTNWSRPNDLNYLNRSTGYHNGSYMNTSSSAHHHSQEDMFLLPSQTDYGSTRKGHTFPAYETTSVTTATHSHRSFFTEALVEDGNNGSKIEPLHDAIYGSKHTLTGTTVLSLPTTSETEEASSTGVYNSLRSSLSNNTAGYDSPTSTGTQPYQAAERRHSSVMSVTAPHTSTNRIMSPPRHHPYILSPGKLHHSYRYNTSQYNPSSNNTAASDSIMSTLHSYRSDSISHDNTNEDDVATNATDIAAIISKHNSNDSQATAADVVTAAAATAAAAASNSRHPW